MKKRIGWRAIARFLAGESPADEATQIRNWAEQDERHGEVLESSRRAWDAAEPHTTDWNVEAAWQNVSSRMKAPPVISIAHARSTRSRRWLIPAIAAAAVVLLLAGPLLYLRFNKSRDYITYETGAGQQRTIRLVDGSVARLAANTSLQVHRKRQREVWLAGTAFFAVTEREAPFTVHTFAGGARVLGTRFELHAVGMSMRLAVLEGRVALSGTGGEQVVHAGHVSATESGAPPSPPRAADVQTLINWMGRVLIFQDTPLQQAAQEVARLYGVQIRITAKPLNDRTVSATFENESLSTVITTICRVVAATCDMQDKVVNISN